MGKNAKKQKKNLKDAKKIQELKIIFFSKINLENSS